MSDWTAWGDDTPGRTDRYAAVPRHHGTGATPLGGHRKRLPDHGVRSRYIQGCRCEACCEANTAYMARYRRAGTGSEHGPLPDELRGDWTDQAACRDQPREWWFPSENTTGRDLHRAVEVCNACPVSGWCRRAGAREEHGIWAGDLSRLGKKLRKRYQDYLRKAA